MFQLPPSQNNDIFVPSADCKAGNPKGVLRLVTICPSQSVKLVIVLVSVLQSEALLVCVIIGFVRPKHCELVEDDTIHGLLQMKKYWRCYLTRQ